ncbi:hybrid sensor histidine kinase/response regulator [Rubrivivax rivuli]|uniref:histidine kinase n=1 Tax=Rubrivivax rivuli TaxID=1862385 RepID=A0A437RD07_9BURK|nr:HAMP domain-containing sensor histidine kinase [Rubrivivax rivuli]RVU44639.1 hybrid sensor histidine kinase/response regulator [Rubrivivax rivuli]
MPADAAGLPAIAGAVPPAAPAPAVAGGPGGRVDHIRALYVQTPATLTGNLIGMALMASMFWSLAPPGRLFGWLAVGATLWLLRLAHYVRFRRQQDADGEQLRLWRRSWMALVLCQGALWGTAVWLFWGLGTHYHVVALILIVYSYCLGSVQLLATQSRVFLAFISLVLTPTIVRIASDTSQAWHLQLAIILTLLFCITVLMARTYGSALGQAITLKTRTDELAGRLRTEMLAAEEARRLADEARRAAEAANRAKTQFFAAASHDLRQPLHAMGLFAEALRQRSHDPEVASLVNSINESVDALEGLFGELLDITRIDTGGVDVNPAPVRLRELFQRLRLHFEPVAFEKGLMLSFRGEGLVAHADPVLLERVLRNLVSNAIRYTDDGGVLVSARLRQRPEGPRLLVQVWDSGIGISEASLPRIWEEFFQAQSNRPLEAHQRKGLGLGLAIVKRLSVLMEAPISVRSRQGHGTVFSLEVPVGKAPRGSIEAAPAGPKMPIGLTLEGRFIVVVEDEAAVREGLVVLLQAWGARVAAFDTVEALEAWLASPGAEPPDLQLVDYRLPQGRTGIDALVALRARWAGRRLPAIVITGSSLGGHEDEAVTHDYHLLIKPVLPNKLRAMIAFKLGVR